MNKLNRKLTATFALALTVGASTLATPQPASAQIVELAGAALGAIFNRPPKPIPNQNYSFATNNLNGNTFSLGSSPVRLPVPSPTPTGMIPPQGSISQSTVTNQVGTLPPGAVPNAVPSGVVQSTPPRPTVIIPPIKLPINLPL